MQKLIRHCFILDLIDDQNLITAYKKYHEEIWPEITQSLLDSGIENRLFMILEVKDSFTFERKEEMDLENPKVQEWERLMWKYQQKLPMAKKGQKWILMDKIFQLKNKI